MVEGIVIREAAQSDQDAVADLMLGLNKFEHKISQDRNINPDAGVKHLAYAQNLVDSQGGFVLLADDDGLVIGFLIGIVAKEDGHFIDPLRRDFGDIHDLYIANTHRGRGLAKQLLAEAEKRFQAMGISRIDLYVLEGNNKAIDFYKSQDFVVHELCMSKKI